MAKILGQAAGKVIEKYNENKIIINDFNGSCFSIYIMR